MDGGISGIGSSELIHFLTSAKYRSSRDQRRKWWRWPLTAPSEPHGGRWTSCNERRKEKRGDDARNRRPEDPTGRGRSPLLELSCPAEHRRQGDRGWLAESSSFSFAFFRIIITLKPSADGARSRMSILPSLPVWLAITQMIARTRRKSRILSGESRWDTSSLYERDIDRNERGFFGIIEE